ncbi:hypothetical protein PF005_g16087 [Phytophthora fragariae]|uniref:RxLR effector protein n=1 Tax=Phytophthora fragariae TaxID=53985 RepID=A0A6A4D526_9STRA|nr:hypothetical protein PF009_g18610 [Phytophthora fragariae]KAE8995483.1 hypothetical protein PF011_g16310 [Phytophthora fragariae]KAE9095010.1 hypothetical protein PF007_g17555 [Phytophthora fragariae]KAE9097959.1 hypothetical protein PF010_g15752 [Phytophthora fragariae]KAE9129675.1 hypothetical protein PF006_g15945 [Phytophthora fragariae]
MVMRGCSRAYSRATGASSPASLAFWLVLAAAAALPANTAAGSSSRVHWLQGGWQEDCNASESFDDALAALVAKRVTNLVTLWPALVISRSEQL